jgi:ubiquinone/menaquinone biosynthesis C-methylase UbiE
MRLRVLLATTVLACALSSTLHAQLGSRSVEEWIKTLDGPQRVATLKIPEVVAALKLQPGQIVADIGAGTGLLEVPLAKAVGPRGKVYAEDIDAGFFPEIKRRAAEGQVTNVETVLGTFTDPALPVKNADLALFHDVIHHVENRAAFLKTLAGYVGPKGRIAVVDFEPGKGPHTGQKEMEVSREDLVAWMQDAGLVPVEDVKLFDDKYVLVFAKR